jgi:hypothetical protein
MAKLPKPNDKTANQPEPIKSLLQKHMQQASSSCHQLLANKPVPSKRIYSGLFKFGFSK